MYWKYRMIHIFLGYLDKPEIDGMFIFYQLWQLVADKRVFFFEGKVEEGNSVSHTIMKLGEFGIGRLIRKSI